ncbi:hypothetical protein [Streptomyces buecherae]|uniref:Uncharacterized protein n=1 Tax=Streptomyces buecherae TaxID=2763006 RepID=A0A7H8N5Q5_9ACTN|nr:hypothetical protein [Streptomyces buecherae]QKW49656.1 hypothetical protein HUT08_08925 [Streptomyces buecherae]
MTEEEAVEAIGDAVEDLTTGRVGVLTDAGPYTSPTTRRTTFLVFIRPERGGVEWTVEPEQVRRHTPGHAPHGRVPTARGTSRALAATPTRPIPYH